MKPFPPIIVVLIAVVAVCFAGLRIFGMEYFLLNDPNQTFVAVAGLFLLLAIVGRTVVFALWHRKKFSSSWYPTLLVVDSIFLLLWGFLVWFGLSNNIVATVLPWLAVLAGGFGIGFFMGQRA